MPEADPRLYLMAGPVLFALGFYALVVRREVLRQILALNVMGNGVFLVFMALAARSPGPVPDPVPQAMVLTGIVVAVAATALALVLADCWEAARAEKAAPKEEDHS